MEISRDIRIGVVDQTTRESSEWIARLNADDASNDDRARFEQWHNSHPDRARSYAELHATWLMLIACGAEPKKLQRVAGQPPIQ
jgi:ferric-dicitrate binding protein FerR (iron transport regulator)